MRFLGRLFPWGCATVLLGVGGCLAFVYFLIGYFQWRNCWFPPTDPDVEVIVSACEEPFLSSLSPDGRYMVYITRYDTNKKPESWIVDLERRQSELDTGCGQWWLGNELRLGYSASPNELQMSFFVCKINDNRHITLKRIPELEAKKIIQANGRWEVAQNEMVSRAQNGELVFSSAITDLFRQANVVYYFSERDWAFALNPDLEVNSESGLALALPAALGRNSAYPPDQTAVLNFLKTNNIPYRQVFLTTRSGTSHNGQFFFKDEIVYRPNGIVETNRVVIPDSIGREIAVYDYGNKWDWLGGCSPHVYGWAFDDSGVFFQLSRCNIMFSPKDPVPPILKLKVPNESLQPTSTP